MWLVWLPLVALAAVLTACGGGSEAKEGGGDVPSGPAAGAAVVVTRDDGSLRAGCRPREVATLVTEFFDAFNRGDAAAAQFFAPELAPNGGWYSVTEGTNDARRNFVARGRDELRQYVSKRRRQNERLRLIELRVNSSRGDIEFLIERRTDDLAALGVRTRRAGGKGAVDCERRKVVVWSMGMPYGGVDALCPAPTTSRRAVIACAKRSRE